jgi:DNA-binding transcriptional LysR family regulator
VATLRQASRAAADSLTKPHGKLRVTAPPALGTTFIAQVVVAYAARYPDVTVELELSNRVVDLIAEGFDIAIRAGRLADSSLVARKFGATGQIVVAAPKLFGRKPLPKKPAELMAYEGILFRSTSGTATWQLQGPDTKSAVEMKGRVLADDFLVARAAALGGAGIALLPKLICAADVRSGHLVRLLPDHESEGGLAYLVYPSARHIPPKVTAFRDLLFEECARLEQDL